MAKVSGAQAWTIKNIPLERIHSPKDNRILAALPATDYERLLVNLESVALPVGWAVYEATQRMTHIYFPTEGIVSLLSAMDNGDSSEVALVGNEGLIGVSSFLGSGSTPSRAIAQSEGRAYRLEAKYLVEEFRRGGEMQHLLLIFTQALIAQIMQTAACHLHHRIDQQFCRWLLLTLDRSPSNEIVMTQAQLAHMAGWRRESISAAANELQQRGLIDYTRGLITVLNRRGLEQRVCECYGVIKREAERVFHMGYAKPRPGKDGIGPERRAVERRALDVQLTFKPARSFVVGANYGFQRSGRPRAPAIGGYEQGATSAIDR